MKVSYCWGDPMRSEKMIIDNAVLKVPKQTYEAVIRLGRDPTAIARGRRTLWIDFICINQEDIEERGQQVDLMHEIYSNGLCNLVYLGKHDPMTQRAVSNINTLIKEIMPESGGEETADSEGSDPFVARSNFWLNTVLQERALRTNIDTDALVHLYSCPWFRRLWVMQEVILSRRNVCVRGPVTFELGPIVFLPLLLTLRHIQNQDFVTKDILFRTGFRSAGNLGACLVGHRKPESSCRGYFPTFKTSRLQQCSQPHDRVFAMLGILKQSTSTTNMSTATQLLRPDYRKPIGDVFRDATRASIITSGDYQHMEVVVHAADHDFNNATMPSWVYPFRPAQSHTELPEFASRFPNWEGRNFSRPEGVPAVSQAAVGMKLESPNELICYGVVLENIDYCTTYWTSRHPRPLLGLAQFVCDAVALIKEAGRTTEDLVDLWTMGGRGSHWGFPYIVEIEQQLASLFTTITSLGPESASADLISDSPLARVNETTVYVEHRKFFANDSGFIGLAPGATRTGDVVAHLFTSEYPCVLRPAGDGRFFFIGSCYITPEAAGHDLARYPEDVDLKEENKIVLC